MNCPIHGEVKEIKSRSYWTTRRVCSQCFPNGVHVTDLDIVEMQKIDADCNDCRHFKRGQFHKGVGLNWFDGQCLKFNKPTKAYPVQFTGHSCFEHRKAA